MIATLKGIIIGKELDHIVLETGGVGYEIFLAAEDIGKAKTGETTRYFIYEHLREDIHALYGFGTQEHKRVFLHLLSVTGIGPKVALAVLSAASIDRLKQAVATGDPDLLKGVAGVGKKTAARIIVELRGKLGEAGAGASLAQVNDSAYQALTGLGYSSVQAAQAVAMLPPEVTDEQERIKLALRQVRQ